MEYAVEYLPDATIDAVLDQQLRDLLSTCFTGPQDHVFKERRYFNDPYPHRWIIRGDHGGPVAHVGVHDRVIHVEEKEYRFGGIAEVSVHPDYRARGLVKKILVVAHQWLKVHGFPFAILLGNPQVYTSSGYKVVDNILYDDGTDTWKPLEHTMVCELADVSWPAATVHMPGKKF